VELPPRHSAKEAGERASRWQNKKLHQKPSKEKRRAKDEVSWVHSLLRTARNNSLPRQGLATPPGELTRWRWMVRASPAKHDSDAIGWAEFFRKSEFVQLLKHESPATR